MKRTSVKYTDDPTIKEGDFVIPIHSTEGLLTCAITADRKTVVIRVTTLQSEMKKWIKKNHGK